MTRLISVIRGFPGCGKSGMAQVMGGVVVSEHHFLGDILNERLRREAQLKIVRKVDDLINAGEESIVVDAINKNLADFLPIVRRCLEKKIRFKLIDLPFPATTYMDAAQRSSFRMSLSFAEFVADTWDVIDADAFPWDGFNPQRILEKTRCELGSLIWAPKEERDQLLAHIWTNRQQELSILGVRRLMMHRGNQRGNNRSFAYSQRGSRAIV